MGALSTAPAQKAMSGNWGMGLQVADVYAQTKRLSSGVQPLSLAVMILETMKLRRRQPRAKSRKR